MANALYVITCHLTLEGSKGQQLMCTIRPPLHAVRSRMRFVRAMALHRMATILPLCRREWSKLEYGEILALTTNHVEGRKKNDNVAETILKFRGPRLRANFL